MVNALTSLLSHSIRQASRAALKYCPKLNVKFQSKYNISAQKTALLQSGIPLRLYSSQPDPSPQSKVGRKKVTINTLRKLYEQGKPITMMTAHDYPTGNWVEKSELDICLVGDSLAMVALGFDSTIPVTMDIMIHHASAVSRAAKTPFLVVDMPFGSYERRPQLGLENAIRLMKEANAEAVKLEGGIEQAGVIEEITQAGIPVMGHIGLTPQKHVMLGGFRVQGKTADKALQLMEDAFALQEAGCMGMVLECIPAPIAEYITDQLSIPTIGIGSGSGCSGQVLVMMDTLGIYDKFVPKFCKQFGQLNAPAVEALRSYSDEIKERSFPSHEFSYPMPEVEVERFLKLAAKRFPRQSTHSRAIIN
ncbi:cell wall biogenesis and architecture protein [Entomophthora muscae]|uniref:Cell wall biogenesis and architecture protein n=1 Tax=Entomophthora muscae TaxID=34485 RepID=A0ACC2T5V5_9FUNG|nr:cell wall biogenesis and architecture protein [Entomophthora muscae]